MRYALSSACKHTEKTDPEHTYTFTGPCIVTKKQQSVTVKGKDLFAYHGGKMIQDAFPYLSNAEREWLISGMSEEGWDQTFPPEEEE